MTDYWDPYEHFVPQRNTFSQRQKRSPWKGTTVCFAIFWPASVGKQMLQQKRTMLRYSVMLLMAHWNAELEYLLN